MRNDDEMIIKSTYRIIRPTDIWWYFDTIAATISVPPVLPLWVKAMPTPVPQRTAPSMQSRNVSGRAIGYASKNGWAIPRNKLRIVVPKIVLSTNWSPTSFHAIARSAMFIT